MTWPEDEDAPRQYWNFLPSFRVAPDAATFLSNRKGSEPTDFNGFTFFKTGGDALQHIFQQVRRLISRQADLCVDHLSYVGTGDREHDGTLCRSCRDVKVYNKKILPDQRFATNRGVPA
jgi:hypothetical protein